ncbi:hypothetical protein CORC01_11824 [Colletotrichum orchidophilum]|uniref:Uncharacterized protein n=1 Tax=Colletotrichum orchidophilum TaxID=1209926 RepID=A0A1G4AUZ8_9PEZI|nr:uncharacterized protein CORC01_11824 [Colletotrichum orchidophilum]OHE92882.1 hypothetical protein CORC01_11824 [Colletotrichum orchidophilum]
MEYYNRLRIVPASLSPKTAAEEVPAEEGDKCDAYISEKGMWGVLDALRMRFAASPPTRKPRIISIGSLSIEEQIDDAQEQLAKDVRPLCLWFIGMIGEEEVLDDDFFLKETSHGSKGSDSSSYPNSDNSSNESDSSTSPSSISCQDWDLSAPPRTPYNDKMEMECTVRIECNKELYSSSLIVRPSLLTYTKPCGLEAVRVGQEGNPRPGWTISRFDAGHWLYQHGICGTMEGISTITT